jgi:nucleotide-binding universal stress UspA family protein
MYDDILIPTDGSDSAEQATRHGVVLAEAYDARVHALSVVDERDYDGDLVRGEELVRAGRTAAEREARRAVEAVADLVGSEAVTSHVEVGVPSQAILDYAAEAGVDLVVMGTHGRTGIERFVIGSVAEKVVRRAAVPVVTVRASDAGPRWPPIDRVLLPTDGSEASFSALPYAFDVAERFDAVVEGLFVVDERTKSNFYNVGTALEDVVGGLQRAAEAATDRIESAGAERGIAVSTTVAEGLPSRTICAQAEESDADLVVMATHGRTGLGHYLLGSVTERVVRNSAVPVLTTPTEPGATNGGSDGDDDTAGVGYD